MPMYKIQNVTCILVILLLVLRCKEQERNIEELKYKIDECFGLLNNIESNPDFQKSPMHLFALNSNGRANNIINELKQTGNDTLTISKKLRLFKKDLITHSYNDSLINKYEDLLTIKNFKFSKKARLELENKVLKANYLFINDMLNALKRLQNNQEELPYMIPLNAEIYEPQAMEAFVILPKPQDSKLVFIYPDSLKYDGHRNHFVYLSGKPQGIKDSILINVIIKKSEFEDEQIVLKTYYKIHSPQLGVD
jgi:hypothetical protein